MRPTPFQKKLVAFFMLVFCIYFFQGCNRYFMPVIVNAPTTEIKKASLKNLSSKNKFFILRHHAHSYAMKNLVLDETNLSITGSLEEIPKGHFLYINAIDNKFKIPKKGRPEDELLREVHLFVTNSFQLDSIRPFMLPLSAVEKIEVIDNDKKRTTKSYVWGAVGITIGAALTVTILAAIINSLISEPASNSSSNSDGSCPFISTLSNNDFELQGEIYSGAINPSLQKEDYLPVKMSALNGIYYLKISNQLKEIQYTDFADLVVVQHHKDVQLLVDPQGNIHSIGQPELPVKATLNSRVDVRRELSCVDYNSCLFKEGNGENNKEDLSLLFNNPAGKTKAKLVLCARGSSWFNYLYNEFTKGFGSYYSKWAKNQEKKSANELDKWAEEQYIPLTISIKTASGWKEVNKLKPIGPLLNREVVIPLEIASEDQVEVKISGGYLFWELDYAAIDFSEDTPFTLQELKPYEAINEKGISVLPELLYADKKYLEQPNVGDSAMIKYKECVSSAGMTQTFFFHTSGYYHHPRAHTGAPKVAFLNSFKQPGALSAFSKRKFFEPINSLETAKK